MDRCLTLSSTAEAGGHLRTLAGARVFFSHQSVGGNLLDGLAELGAHTGTGPNIIPLDRAYPADGPGLLHAFGGENGRPDSKLAFFEAALDGLTRKTSPEVALMKFCYADFTPETDVEELLSRYRAAFDRAARHHRRVLFVHVTVPLTTRPMGIKARACRLVGRRVWQDAANQRRHLFNQRLRAAFEGQAVFDLARVESTRPDGGDETFQRDGRACPALCPGYAADDGHLNGEGRRAVAPEFARVLASAVTTRRAWS